MIVRFTPGTAAFGSWHMTRPGPVFTFGLGATGQMIPAFAAMVGDLLFERFPKLKVVSVEAGCGYAAYLMDRLDELSHALEQEYAAKGRHKEKA